MASASVGRLPMTGDTCTFDRCGAGLNAAGMEVVARQLALPKSYGTPDRVLGWPEVEQKLAASKSYWLATTRPDGRPHTVPVDGIWLEDALYFDGDPATVHIRNLRSEPRAVVHTESGESPVIAEGTAKWHQPSQDEIGRLVEATRTKYGYPVSPDSYSAGTWRLSPTVVLAWNVLYQDATRFTLAR
jgi:hypothetical protein